MSTAGAQDPPRDHSSSDVPRPRNDSSNIRFILSCKVSRSRNGSHRTIAMIAPPLEWPAPFGRGAGVSSLLDRVLRIDHVVGLATRAARRAAARGRLAGARTARRLRSLVERFGHAVAELGHTFHRLLDRGGVLALHGLAGPGDRLLDLARL